MFRIKRIFDNELTTILKIEGDISSGNLLDWKTELNQLIQYSTKEVILEIHESNFTCPQALDILKELISEKVFLLNCPTNIRNVLCTNGLSASVLD